MTSEARGQDDFTIHSTHGQLPHDAKPDKLLDFFRKDKKAGKKYSTVARDEDALGIKIPLL